MIWPLSVWFPLPFGLECFKSVETGLKPPEIFGRTTKNQVLQKHLQYVLERPVLIHFDLASQCCP